MRMNRYDLINRFELPKTEVELTDALKNFLYVDDKIGLLIYVKLLVKELNIVFENN